MSATSASDVRLELIFSAADYRVLGLRAEPYGLGPEAYLTALATGTLPDLERSEKSSGEGDLALLRRFDLLSSLSEDELLQALDRLRIRHFRTGEVVLLEEDVNHFMYVILEGRVRVVRCNEEGREIVLAIHSAGDYFGEMSLIDGRGTSATVAASEPSTVAILSRDDFYSLLLGQHKFLMQLLQTFCHRLRHSNMALEIMSSMSAEQRVRLMLQALCNRHGTPEAGGWRLGIVLTHQEMAGMTGLARETVSRVLAQWRDSGLLQVGAGRRIWLDGSLCKPFFNL